MVCFRNRREAGRVLGELVRSSVTEPNPLVLGLPRGGVPVACEVAAALDAELDIFLVRKLGMPGEEELALGAIASGGIRVLNHDLIRYLQVPDNVIEEVTVREQAELRQREQMLRKRRPPISAQGRTVVLVDDGLATGASMLAATRALRPLAVKSITVAVPVAAPATCAQFRAQVDRVICVATPHPFGAVGTWYENFSPTTDEDVRELLQEAAAHTAARHAAQ